MRIKKQALIFNKESNNLWNPHKENPEGKKNRQYKGKDHPKKHIIRPDREIT